MSDTIGPDQRALFDALAAGPAATTSTLYDAGPAFLPLRGRRLLDSSGDGQTAVKTQAMPSSDLRVCGMSNLRPFPSHAVAQASLNGKASKPGIFKRTPSPYALTEGGCHYLL